MSTTACTRTLAVGIIGAFLLAIPAFSQSPAPLDRPGDREQITTILSQWEDAWNRHDMTAFASLFHEDGVWVLWTGSVWKGRVAIETGHAEVHRTFFRNSTQREQLDELAFVGPDAAVVRFCSVLTGDSRAPDSIVRSLKFLVVTKRQGTWKISWGQNTRLADTVQDSECFASLRRSLAPPAGSNP